MRFIKKTSLVLSGFLFVSCASIPATTRNLIQSESQSDSEVIAVSTATVQPHPLAYPSTTLIFIPHPEGDLQKIYKILSEHPQLRITMIFPSKYFDLPQRRTLYDAFRILQSSAQIEIGLSLDNAPILPLLANLKHAGEKTAKWDFQFSWPEDVAYQIARGSAKYQKRWGDLPSGFYPPHNALSDEIIESLRRFRLNWVMGKPNSIWGVQFMGALALLVSEPQPSVDELEPGSSAWAHELTKWVFSRPFTLMDASLWENPHSEIVFLEKVALMAEKEPGRSLVTARIFCESLGEEFNLPKEFKPFDFDFSKWVNNNQQKRIWRALAEAREVIEKYKNSGRANLQRLDAAMEEMASAEDGSFLLALGENQPVTDSTEKNFLATLANIFRLCNVPVPSNINNLLAERSFQKSVSKPAENDRPFFIEGAQSLTWNDPTGDDFGGGQYTYPSGRYPKGAFDLRELTMEWDDVSVTFSVSTVNSASYSSNPVIPLADIYIDINKYSGAGSTSPLKKRSTTLLYKEAAWEYAVSMTPSNSALVQSVPGGDPRLIRWQKSEFSNNSFFATFSRDLLRGDPRNWRLSMALLATENNRKTEEFSPIPVLNTAGERNFGGAASGRSAPPYIDIMAPSAEEQINLFTPYQSGAKILLYYFEPK